MSRFEIHPIQEQSLSEVADFFASWRKREEQSSATHLNGDSNPSRIESIAYLRWLLVENPARNGAMDLGYCVRDRSGAAVGAILTFPCEFVRGGKRLKALCGASLFVNGEASIQGFIILKKFLNTAGYDFFFTTTCNATAGALWNKLPGHHSIPNSESTYILPLRFERLFEAFAENKKFHPWLVASLRAAGSIGSAIVRVTKKPSRNLKVVPCRDWEKLSELARKHRNPEWITNERSAKFLEWRYGNGVAGVRKELYSFADRSGNEGWFAISSGLTGGEKKFQATELLDFVWPDKKVDPREIVSAIVALSSSTSDALYMRPRIGVPFKEFSRLVLRRNLSSPQYYVMPGKGNEHLEPAAFDFVLADGDSRP